MEIGLEPCWVEFMVVGGGEGIMGYKYILEHVSLMCVL